MALYKGSFTGGGGGRPREAALLEFRSPPIARHGQPPIRLVLCPGARGIKSRRSIRFRLPRGLVEDLNLIQKGRAIGLQLGIWLFTAGDIVEIK